jgi:hypothetical protein
MKIITVIFLVLIGMSLSTEQVLTALGNIRPILDPVDGALGRGWTIGAGLLRKIRR